MEKKIQAIVNSVSQMNIKEKETRRSTIFYKEAAIGKEIKDYKETKNTLEDILRTKKHLSYSMRTDIELQCSKIEKEINELERMDDLLRLEFVLIDIHLHSFEEMDMECPFD